MILITGASSGIGAATARRFAADGQALFLIARRADRLHALAEELRALPAQPEIQVWPIDLTDRAALLSGWASHREGLERTEVLVNNAGLALGRESIESGNLEDWDRMIDTNLKSVLAMTQLVLPHMIARKRGSVVMLGSVAGYHAYPGGNVYSATKFAIRGLTQSLRTDLLGKGVRVIEIAPGMVETEFSEVRFKGDRAKAEAVYDRMKALSAEDIADAIHWSVSRPAHVNIETMVIYPTDQASPSLIHRR